MRIAVYCGSKTGNDPAFIEKTRELGEYIGSHGHDLVFGASDTGLMGVVARGVKENGGKLYGVPLKMFENERIASYSMLDYKYVADTFYERRNKMIELADAFIALPGGVGTLDEISEVMCLCKFYFPEKKVMFYNINGFYDDMKKMLSRMDENDFLYEKNPAQFPTKIEEIDEILNK
ncbi:MAG: TIGR00730 family Rossman fold protein [Bacilli bacterium]|nr:TIGR00730 family Rossman fold protein [Bacilli bacterium]